MMLPRDPLSWRTREFLPLLLATLLPACRSGLASRGQDGISPTGPTAGTGTQSCPLTAPAEWQDYLAKTADDDRWVQTCEDSTCDAEFYRVVDQGLAATLAACADVIQQHPGLAKCTEHVRSFVPSWMRMHDSASYGFTDANGRYLAREESADRPQGMMVVPPELVAALPDRAKVEAVSRDHGWRYVAHDSALIGGRLFINVRDAADRFDQWLIFNFDIDAKGAASAVVNTNLPVSLLAVQKKTAAGDTLPKVRLNFRDHHIVDAGGGSFTLQVAADGNGKCYGCHPSGVRQLLPIRTQVLEARPVKGDAAYAAGAAAAPADFAYTRLQELNERLASYGLPDWEGEVDPATHGPPLGAELGCTRCHDGAARGLLTVSTSMAQLHEKIGTELAMPPTPGTWSLEERAITQAPPLTAAEQATIDQSSANHAQVEEQFMAGRLPALKAWLLETACQ